MNSSEQTVVTYSDYTSMFSAVAVPSCIACSTSLLTEIGMNLIRIAAKNRYAAIWGIFEVDVSSKSNCV